jgi:phage/plasmid-associated DNA primase
LTAGDGALKALVTERVTTIEPKGVNAFQMPNRVKLMLASNNDWCIPASAEARRYFVCDVSEERVGDRTYFNDIQATLKEEAAAMLHDLLHLDLTGFSHRDVPHTAGLNNQKMETLDSVGRWWAGCLEQGRIVGGPIFVDQAGEYGRTRWPVEMEKGRLHYLYTQHCHEHGDRHPKGEATFPKAWRKLAPSVRNCKPHARQRVWLFQNLDHHRAEFLKAMKMDRWDWPAVDSEGGDEPPENVTGFKARV